MLFKFCICFSQKSKLSLSFPVVGVFNNVNYENTLNFQPLPYIPCIDFSTKIRDSKFINFSLIHYSTNNFKNFTGNGLLSKTGYFFSLSIANKIVKKKKYQILYMYGTSLKITGDSRFFKPIGFWHSVQDKSATGFGVGSLNLGLIGEMNITKKIYFTLKVNSINFFFGSKYQRNTIIGEYGIGLRF